MASAINIVLNAVDKYSSTLTGLNQGLELLSKGFGLVKDAAGFAFDTIGKGVELARLGGAFDEQRNQFENLANSYKLNGQQIIDTVQEISGRTLTEFQSIRTATVATASGLRGKEMEEALQYAKRWSEATGGSFEDAAERIFTALSSGRTSVLKQMGLVVEQGAKVEQITAAISQGLKRFGDTGFNTADALDSLGAAQDDLARKVGQGVNQSKEFQSVLGGVADAVFKFVKGFDPKPISVFFDLLVSGAKGIGRAFFDAFPAVGKGVDALLSDTSKSIESFSKFAINTVFGIARSVGEGVNLAIDFIQGANIGNIFSKAAQSVSLVVGTLVEGTVKAIGGAIDFILGGLDDLSSGVAEIVRSFPNVAEALGIDPEQIDQLGSSIDKVRQTISGGLDGIGNFAFAVGEKIALGLDDFNDSAEKYKVNLNSIDAAQKRALSALQDKGAKLTLTADYSGLLSAEEELRIKSGAAREEEKARQAEEKAAIKARENAAKDAAREEIAQAKNTAKAKKDAYKEAEQAAKEAEREAVAAAKEAAKEKNILAEQEAFKKAALAKAARREAEQAEAEAEAASAKAEQLARNTADRVRELLGDAGTIKVDLDKRFDPKELENLINGKIKTDLEIKLSDDLSEKKKADESTLDENTVLQALVKLLLNALSGAAAGEGVPIAVTSA